VWWSWIQIQNDVTLSPTLFVPLWASIGEGGDVFQQTKTREQHAKVTGLSILFRDHQSISGLVVKSPLAMRRPRVRFPADASPHFFLLLLFCTCH
jgi:hypothetical protein